MFTGIITDIGSVLSVEANGDLRVRIATAYDVDSIDIGASIACDGICLTVVGLGKTPEPWFDVDISGETVTKTRLSTQPWQPGARVNLERALRLGDELGGHIVSGHVDGVAQQVALHADGDSTVARFRLPTELACYVAPKGSITLNGTSLTVNLVENDEFTVNFIPHTQTATTWGGVKPGDLVNVEIDMLARYVARLRSFEA